MKTDDHSLSCPLFVSFLVASMFLKSLEESGGTYAALGSRGYQIFSWAR